MKRFLIAVGAGALLIGAQAAVSAAYDPLDRVDAPAKEAEVTGAVATTTTGVRDYTAFADTPTRFDAAFADTPARVEVGSDEVTATTSANNPVVTDRLGPPAPSYNDLLIQSSTPGGKCTKTKSYDGGRATSTTTDAASSEDCQNQRDAKANAISSLTLVTGVVLFGIVITEAFSDDGDSD